MLAETLAQSSEMRQHLGTHVCNVIQENAQNSGDVADNKTIRQRFTATCLQFLSTLKSNLESERSASDVSHASSDDTGGKTPSGKGRGSSQTCLPPGSLSVVQEKTVNSALQFLLVFGLNPFLMSGVGIPVSKRLGPGQILLASIHDYNEELSDLDRIKCLLPVVILLEDLISEPSLKEIIINNYLADMVAAVLQIRHCAKVLLQKTGNRNNSGDGNTEKCLKVCPAKPCRATTPADGSASLEPVLTSSSRTHLQPSSLSSVSHSTAYESAQRSEQKLSSEEVPLGLPLLVRVNGEEWGLPRVVEFCGAEIDRTVKSSPVGQVLQVLLMLSGGQKSGPAGGVKCPVWFRRTVAGILRDVIMEPPNVQHLLVSFVGDQSLDSVSTQEWRKCVAVAQVISRCPVTPANVERFYSSVSQQLVKVVRAEIKGISPLILRAVGLTVTELHKLQPELMCRVCFVPLLAPLVKCSLSPAKQYGKDGAVVVTENVFTSCVGCLHRIYIGGQEPDSPVLVTLQSVVGVLFDVFVQSKDGVTQLRRLSFDLVQAYVASLPMEDAVTCLLSVTHDPRARDTTLTYAGLHRDVLLTPGDTGGLQAVYSPGFRFTVDSLNTRAEAVMDVVAGPGLESVRSRLFLLLLEKLTQIVSAETDNSDVILPARVISQEHKQAKLAELTGKISMMTLLAMLTEKYGAEVIQSCHHILLFAKATLERCVKICESTRDDLTSEFEAETTCMAMGLLTAVLSGAIELQEKDKSLLDELLPLVTCLSEHQGAEPAVREMAQDLKVGVATRGLVSMQLSKEESAVKDRNETPASRTNEEKKPLIEELLSETDTAQGSGLKAQSSFGKELTQAFEELNDPLLPVKGHGLIRLAGMVEGRHPEVTDRQELLVKVFLEHLGHSDSYIYLAAVNGLAALADLCPDQVIPRLCSEFRSKCMISEVASPEVTLKTGEALVKAVRRLGELTLVYREPLLPTMLCGCRHDDALVRASSLSGLADTCRLLRFAVGPVLQEILTCCRDVMASDPHPEPRKAATMTLTLLLQGLGKDSLLALSDVMRDVYRVLKHSLTSDPDEQVKVHANLALAELDDIMREVLFAPPELRKKITILGYQ
ncbi:transport and Golgi organization protein 6 homolog isoform X2 [Aplysia californica]|nr:transport and Golgi organization protein 6 homolog isoform X2 [Aplysia californica]